MSLIANISAALGLALALLTSFPAASQEWPNKPVRIVVGFPAGGTNDIVARAVAQHLTERLGTPFVVDNRPGAGGNVGTDLVAKAAPDGYTLVMASNGALASNRFLYKNMPFNADKDFAPIVLVGEVPILFAAHPKLAANDLKGLVELARAQPGRINIGTPGNGTIGHLTLILLQTATNASLQHVPYKGDAPAVTDALGGNIEVVAGPASGYSRYVLAGSLKGLAVTTRRRSPSLPNVPTAIEQGIDIEAASLIGLYGPAGLPAGIVRKLNQEVNAYLAMPEARAKLLDAGVNLVGGTPEQLAEVMAKEVQKWKRVVDAAGGVHLD